MYVDRHGEIVDQHGVRGPPGSKYIFEGTSHPPIPPSPITSLSDYLMMQLVAVKCSVIPLLSEYFTVDAHRVVVRM